MQNRLEWSETCLKAFQIAMGVHSAHKDKSGMTYFWHPLRVANNMKGWRLQTIALLHDAVEDGTNLPYDLLKLLGVSDQDINEDGTSMTVFKLRHLGIADEEVLTAVDALTRRKEEKYTEYLKRVKQNQLARVVKLADIDDNMSVERLSYLPVDRVLRMVTKYWSAMRYLRDIDAEDIVESINYESVIRQEYKRISKEV